MVTVFSVLLNIILFVLILGILVFVHELGHFLVAKKCGVYIYEFSIGMGPAIKTIKGKDGIDYSIRALPLGGYVQMAGEIYEDDDSKKIPKKRFMCNRPWWQRLLILCAGVFNNFVLALLLLFFIALVWGARSLSPTVDGVVEGSAAEQAGIKAGDVITKVNGRKVKTWDKAQIYLILKDKDGAYDITVDRDGESITFSVTPTIKNEGEKNETHEFGIQSIAKVKKGFIPAVKYAFQKFFAVWDQMLITVFNLFTGGISIGDLSGPVGIYEVVGEARKTGVANVIYLMAYLSLNLGVMNILPIPALDGGHVLFLLIELVTRRKMNAKVENVITTIFFALLLLLMLYVTIHDVIKLF